jgi:hypothetical protein
MRRLILALSVAVIAVLTLPLIAVLAHEHRTIAGKYDVEVGWDHEPALVGQINGVSINIHRAGTEDAVEGVDGTLKVRIAFGGNEPKEFTLRSVEDKKGYYLADLIPTRAGSYVFTFVGKIEDTDVNEKFESGPGRFDDVDTSDALQFPQAAPDNLTLANDLNAARQDVGSVRGLAITALALAVVALVVAGANTAKKR